MVCAGFYVINLITSYRVFNNQLSIFYIVKQSLGDKNVDDFL